MWASGLRTAVLPAQEADWQQDLYVGQSLFTWGSPSGGPWPSECGGPQNRRWPPKADVYADSGGSPQKTPAQSRPRKTRHTGRRPSGIPWAHSLELFALVLRFYREFSQLMDDCTGRQPAHKLRLWSPTQDSHLFVFLLLIKESNNVLFRHIASGTGTIKNG